MQGGGHGRVTHPPLIKKKKKDPRDLGRHNLVSEPRFINT